MSTTLTNGLKLPDKGSVDWYADMQSNYTILDGAVGTVAEHTSALAGKAPLVHTHSKSDITDFPVYGTTAGTICEGNDSRLSDARTPVAHTHGKADITDLFNSANTWTAEQNYSKNLVITCTATPGVAPSTDMVSGFRMKNAENSYSFVEVVGRIGTSGVTYANLVATNKFKNGNIDVGGSSKSASIQVGIRANGDKFIYTDCEFRNSLVPYSLDLGNHHLGTSTNKWKTLNGINPGALSLPNSPGGTGTENVNYFDLSGNITVRDGSVANSFTALCDGWISIETFATWLQISNDTLIIATTAGIGADGFAQAFLPVRKGNYIRVVVNQTNTQFQSFKLLPCEGNV